MPLGQRTASSFTGQASARRRWPVSRLRRPAGSEWIIAHRLFSGTENEFIMAGDLLADIFGSVGDLKQDDGVRAKAKTAKRPVAALGAKERARATPRLRIVMGKGLMLGPGKIDLLEAIARKGSISPAAREMDMSYRRAWLLVDALNPHVQGAGGGRGGLGLRAGAARASQTSVASSPPPTGASKERTRTAIAEELAPFD